MDNKEPEPCEKPAVSVEKSDQFHQDEEGKNTKFIRCTFCSCLVLRPNTGYIIELEKTIPKIDGKNEPETIKKFWCIDDIYQFENMSFSKTVDNMKFLSCCDCDIGPIGYQDLDSKICYLIPDRITYKDK